MIAYQVVFRVIISPCLKTMSGQESLRDREQDHTDSSSEEFQLETLGQKPKTLVLTNEAFILLGLLNTI